MIRRLNKEKKPTRAVERAQKISLDTSSGEIEVLGKGSPPKFDAFRRELFLYVRKFPRSHALFMMVDTALLVLG